MHLTPEELIDLAEGTRTAEVPHLATCDACRRELANLRAMLSVAADVSVPEPPASFWNSLSQRVREATAAESAGHVWWRMWLRPVVVVPATAIAICALLVLVLVTDRAAQRPAGLARTTTPSAETRGGPTAGAVESMDINADPSLMLVAELSAGMDLDAAAASGFASRGSADEAVAQMSADELRTLHRLLQTELGRPGA
jgi:hypothetical protein